MNNYINPDLPNKTALEIFKKNLFSDVDKKERQFFDYATDNRNNYDSNIMQNAIYSCLAIKQIIISQPKVVAAAFEYYKINLINRQSHEFLAFAPRHEWHVQQHERASLNETTKELFDSVKNIIMSPKSELQSKFNFEADELEQIISSLPKNIVAPP